MGQNIKDQNPLSPYLERLWSIQQRLNLLTIPLRLLHSTTAVLKYDKLKSLSPIYFVKIRPPDFLCNEFFIKMYRFLQTYTFEICTLTKIMNICCKYNIFTGRLLFTRKGNQLISYPRTLVCYCRFDTVFIFIVNSYKYQNVFKISQQTS